MVKEDFSNKKFNKLYIVEFAGKDKYGARLWNCLCDCGYKVVTTTGHLSRGEVKTCGCSRRKVAKESTFNVLYANYKNKAKNRGFDFVLSKEEFKFLTQENCNYCGVKPNQIIKPQTRNEQWKCDSSFKYNGIDRVDNTKGYILENVVTCCGKCNRMKMDLDQSDFLKHVAKILQFIGNKDAKKK